MLACLAAAVLAAAPAASTSGGFWLDAAPRDPAEAALAAAVARAADEAALLRLAEQHAGAPVAGLARLAAGLSALEGGRAAEALAALDHPDLALSGLADHAGLGRARALLQLGQAPGAADAFRDRLRAENAPALSCRDLRDAAEAFEDAGRREELWEALGRVAGDCPADGPAALLRLARSREGGEAAAAYDRLVREFPLSPEAREALVRLRALPPAPGGTDGITRELARAGALLPARPREAVAVLRAIPLRGLDPERTAEVRVRLGRALLALRRERDARRELAAVPASSPLVAEAAFLLARADARRARSPEPWLRMAEAFPGTPWAEEALLNAAQHHERDGAVDAAGPYYQRLLQAFPEGRYVERCAMRAGLWHLRQGRLEEAARVLEGAARRRSLGNTTAGFLFWAARAHGAAGRDTDARALWTEAAQRFKHTYYGSRALEALGPEWDGPVSAAPPLLPAASPDDETYRRARRLLLIGRPEEARAELARRTGDPLAEATVAHILWTQGRLRPAIGAMRRAYPDWLSERGDRLPAGVWRILFPLDYEEALVARSREQGLDPALVAALIWQESTFDASSVSRAGARGIMQIIPATGRKLAREVGLRYRTRDLHDPSLGLRLGTRYLRQMIDAFGGRVERALAAYNAGPGRVSAWTAGREDMAAEEFVERIPFTETRQYVMSVLAHREQYRRLYGLSPQPPGAPVAP